MFLRTFTHTRLLIHRNTAQVSILLHAFYLLYFRMQDEEDECGNLLLRLRTCTDTHVFILDAYITTCTSCQTFLRAFHFSSLRMQDDEDGCGNLLLRLRTYTHTHRFIRINAAQVSIILHAFSFLFLEWKTKRMNVVICYCD